MAHVFVADETALGRRVVVKVLASELAEGLSAERFAREVRLAARLQHPNILPVFAAGAAGGSPYYTMPDVDHRADLYAWGVVAYEVLSGQHPFAGKRTAQAFVVAPLIEMPQPLDDARGGIPPTQAALVMRCLAKAPGDRPASAGELIDVLGTVLSAGDGVIAPPRSAAPSIAVLPFVNQSADPEAEYFSDGISEKVLSALAKDPGLRVAARSSSFAFKGTIATIA